MSCAALVLVMASASVVLVFAWSVVVRLFFFRASCSFHRFMHSPQSFLTSFSDPSFSLFLLLLLLYLLLLLENSRQVLEAFG